MKKPYTSKYKAGRIQYRCTHNFCKCMHAHRLPGYSNSIKIQVSGPVALRFALVMEVLRIHTKHTVASAVLGSKTPGSRFALFFYQKWDASITRKLHSVKQLVVRLLMLILKSYLLVYPVLTTRIVIN